jgi:hypothetical protein
MSDFYICEKNDVLGHQQQFKDSHYVDLPDGRILVSANFHSEHFMGRWSAQPHVEKITHDDEAVTSDQSKTLKHLGIKPGHTKTEVRKLVKKVHRLFGN